jgi:drug/metabolite transporter (DMT)-like permease
MTSVPPDPASAWRALAPTPRQAALAGIGLMLLGIFLFVVNDVLGKWLVATYSVGQILLIRSVAALILLAPLIWREGRGAMLQPQRPALQLLRVVLSTAEVVAFYVAVAYLPLADVITFYLASPIYVTALAGPLLGEKVGWRRWSAVIIGFCGVLIALRPSGATLSAPSLIAFSGSLMFAFLMIATRSLRGTPDIVLVSWQTIAALIFGLIAAPFGWVAPTGRDYALLAALGIVAAAAHFCVNRALKLAPAAVVVPYQYTQIVWAVLLGFLVFGDIPHPQMVIGCVIIIGAGLYIFVREQTAAALTHVDPP